MTLEKYEVRSRNRLVMISLLKVGFLWVQTPQRLAFVITVYTQSRSMRCYRKLWCWWMCSPTYYSLLADTDFANTLIWSIYWSAHSYVIYCQQTCSQLYCKTTILPYLGIHTLVKGWLTRALAFSLSVPVYKEGTALLEFEISAPWLFFFK